MNFVISPEQTSQSGTNPMILPPSRSDRGGWGPSSASPKRGGGREPGREPHRGLRSVFPGCDLSPWREVTSAWLRRGSWAPVVIIIAIISAVIIIFITYVTVVLDSLL